MKSKRLAPRRMVVFGFIVVILTGTALLMLPVSSSTGKGITFTDSLFMSTSAVCVTGLACIDPGTSLSVFGKIVLAVLIQAGGLGITVIGVILIIAAGGRLSMGNQRLIKESLNLNSGRDLSRVIAGVAYMTILFETAGAALSYITFYRDYGTLDAVGISVFHSIASFNNAGFDILGDFRSLTDYNRDIWLCIVTSVLIIAAGIGFFVFSELKEKKSFRRWSLHTKIVVTVTLFLIIAGTLLIKLSEGSGASWLESYFQSVSSRTAGFATLPTGDMSNAGLLVLMVLMFIGASPGSTGGGIKTVTAFVIFKRIVSVILTRHCSAFRRNISDKTVMKSFTVAAMALSVIITAAFLMSLTEPDFSMQEIVFEVVSGFTTTGLSMGITPELCVLSKIVLVFTMFIGRLGPLTIATIWLNRELSDVKYSEEDVMIG